MLNSNMKMTEMFELSEQIRKRFASELGTEKSRYQEVSNKANQLQENKRLTAISMDLLHDKMVTLYESIENISDVKSLEEKYQQQKEELEERFRIINSEEIEKMVKLRMAIKRVEQTEKDNKFIIE